MTVTANSIEYGMARDSMHACRKSTMTSTRTTTTIVESTNIYFFFSSRRRHTRFDCDWSSDVCSSDLVDPVHHEIERAAVIQVNVDRSVRESRRGQSPRIGNVGERQIAGIPKNVVRRGDRKSVV